MQPLHILFINASHQTLCSLSGTDQSKGSCSASLPCAHALRDGKEALIEISGLKILQGNVPPRELSEVLQWAASNRNMLMNKFEELQK